MVQMKRIVLKGLFGRFNYDIDFMDDGLTLLTGPNGFGKTTILLIIEALSNGVLGVLFLLELPFDEIVAYIDGEKSVVIHKDIDVLKIDGLDVSQSLFDTIWGSIRERYALIGGREYSNLLLRGKEKTLKKYLENIEWNDIDYLNLSKKERTVFDKLINKFNDYRGMFGRVMLIRDQRMFRLNNNNHKDNEAGLERIKELSDEFFSTVDGVKRVYSSLSGELDSTFLERLLKTKCGITENEYNLNISKIRNHTAQIKKYGFAEFSEPSDMGFEDEHAKALKVYFEDYNKKLDVFDGFIKRVELFSDIINQKLLFKNLNISIDKGIQVVDDNGFDIALIDLSSGEKQEVVVCYDLVFNSKELSLLMIDEPEISLHVAWQKCFVNDLKNIMKINKFEAIVATHSPQIINGYWDEQVDLGELYG